MAHHDAPTGDRLRRLAHELENLADDCDQPARTADRVERRIAEAERIAQAVWGVVRGRT